jgi:tRNA-splicing ligase RtcB
MPPRQLNPRLLSWASELDPATAEQAANTAKLPFIAGHVALMPDAHLGKGATIGSVIPTTGAIIPAAVGVDIGCGMVAALTDLTAADLPDDLRGLLARIGRGVPAGVGRGHDHLEAGETWYAAHPSTADLSDRQVAKTVEQFGTLGSGNHFLEVCLDQTERVWLVLHSGSRGIGNQLAQRHIEIAKGLMRRWFIELPDPDLAYLVQGTDEFDAYVRDLRWAQDYAFASRERMADVALSALAAELGRPVAERHRINCHHNYTARERHHGRDLWITRKGAILARAGVEGIVPGSMATGTYLVRGKGSAAAYDSSAHGAGRRLSRSEARRRFTGADLAERMGDRTWLADRADKLVDEIPDSYKPIDQVMADQADLVEVTHVLRQVLNYKGT